MFNNIFMTLTANETTFLLWALSLLLGIIATGVIAAAKSLVGMAKDINEIKTTAVRIEERHDGLEKRVELLERK